MNAVVKSFFISLVVLALSVPVYAVDKGSIIAYWPCNEGKGQTVADAVGGANGVMMSGAGWTGTPHDQAWAVGRFGAGLDLTKKEQSFVSVKSTSALASIGKPGSVFTVAFWGKTNEKNEKILAFDKGSIKGTRGWHAGLCCGGFPFTEVNSPPELAGFHAPAVLVADGQWHHVAFVYRMGKSTSIYVDGKLTKNADTHTITDVSNQLKLTIGATGSAEGFSGMYFKGSLDDIAIFNRELTEAEIKELSLSSVSAVASAVEPRNKLGTTWAEIKTRY